MHIRSDLILHNWKQPIAGARTEEVEVHQGGEGAAAGAGEEAGAGKLLLSSHFSSVKINMRLRLDLDSGAREEAAGVHHTEA